MEKNRIHIAGALIVLWSAGFSAGSAQIKESNKIVKTYPFSDPGPAAIIARHDSWDANSLGNHCVVIDVTRAAGAVAVHIPWRRRDFDPQKKKVILIDAKTSRRIDNVYPVEVNREFGDFIFEPVTVPGVYYMYYMPYQMTGRHCERIC